MEATAGQACCTLSWDSCSLMRYFHRANRGKQEDIAEHCLSDGHSDLAGTFSEVWANALCLDQRPKEHA
jgi:hypothetical protein